METSGEKSRRQLISLSATTIQNVRLAVDEDKDRWNRFVFDHSGGGYCHLFEWYRVLNASYGTDCRFLLYHNGDHVEGVLPLAYMPGRLAGNRLISLPFLDQGGILAASQQTGQALRDAALELARQLGATGIDLRADGLTTPSPVETSRYLFLLELSPDTDSIWKRLHSKVRNQIRKSEKVGLVTRRADPAELPAFHEVFARNMHDLGSPVHARSFFHNILAMMDSHSDLYLTSNSSGRVIAGGIAIRFRDRVTVPWASALREERSSCPNHSLYWRILRDAAEERATVFDFGRSSEGTGTYRFKKQWGTSIEPLVWTSVDPAGESQDPKVIDPRRHSLIVDTWRRLPLAVTRRLGPSIRGRLPN